MQIRVVVENASGCGLPTEHGLCLWVETGGRKFMFDLGQSGLFAENAARMGIEVREAEFAIVSHGHYDHGGGLRTFMALNETAPVYVHRKAWGEHYSIRDGKETYIGLDSSLAGSERLVLTDSGCEIVEGITLFAGSSGHEFCSPANRRILRSERGQMVCDDFCHEQSLIIQEGESCVLIAGCAHGGVLNIIARAEEVSGKPITHVVAGMHVKGVDDHAFIRGLAEALKAKDCMCYTCHCTGSEAYEEMKMVLGDKIAYVGAGDTIEIGV
ncbi:MAG: MBL fold metallo-hydrolase [Bacteroidaceae bacterium]|nr:MBL fold metallo-hydrolase [Bacteroidaceae bacterium]